MAEGLTVGTVTDVGFGKRESSKLDPSRFSIPVVLGMCESELCLLCSETSLGDDGNRSQLVFLLRDTVVVLRFLTPTLLSQEAAKVDNDDTGVGLVVRWGEFKEDEGSNTSAAFGV